MKKKTEELMVFIAMTMMIVISLVMGIGSLLFNTWAWHVMFVISFLGLVGNFVFILYNMYDD